MPGKRNHLTHANYAGITVIAPEMRKAAVNFVLGVMGMPAARRARRASTVSGADAGLTLDTLATIDSDGSADMDLDFSRCRKVWVPDESEAGGFWNPVFEHVKEAVRKIVTHPYLLLADDMGLSKTASAIISAQFLHDADVIDRVIVVAPAALRSAVWFSESFGQLREQVFEDKRNVVSEYHAKIHQWSHGPEAAKELRWIVTNYEYVRTNANLVPLLKYCGPRTMLILDESSAVRGYKSAQTEACMLLRWKQNAKGRPVIGAPRCGRILEMNGTPVAESPLDLFSQANLLHQSILDCRHVTQFKARYAVQGIVRRSGGEAMLNPRTGRPLQVVEGWTPEGIADLQHRLAPYVLRREAKSLGIDFALPPVGMDVPLTPATWKIYNEMRREMVVWLKSGVATAQTAAVKVMRLAQITSGFLGGIEDANIGDDPGTGDVETLWDIGDHDGNSDRLDAGKRTTVGTAAGDVLPVAQVEGAQLGSVQAIGREKLDFALEWHAEMLRRCPDLKLLTWCRFVPELRRYLYEERLTFPSIPVGAACGEKVLGGMQNQKAEREHALRLLHPKTAPVGPATVGATQGTGAMGLNFTACRTVLDMSYDFSPWKKRQGDARVNRPGQTGMVSFFYLVAVGPKGQRTIDHHVMLTRLGKMNINDLTVAGWVKLLEVE